MLTSNKLWLLVIFLISAVLLLPYARYPDFDPDLLWHLFLGRDLVNGLDPYIDTHSYTYFGKSTSHLPWIFEWVSYKIFENWGHLGLQFFKGTLWFIALLSMSYFVVSVRLPISLAIIYFSIGVYAHQLKFLLRPDTLTLCLYPIFIVLFYQLKTLHNTQLSSKNTWEKTIIIALSLGLLSNWHSSTMLLYCVLLALFADTYIRLFLNKSDIKGNSTSQLTVQSTVQLTVQLTAQLVVILLPGFLNPSLNHPLIFFFNMSDQWRNHIMELAPPNLELYPMLATGAIALGVIALVFAIYTRRYFEAFCLIGLGSKSFSVSRMIVINLIILSPFVAILLRDLRDFLVKSQIRESILKTAYGVALLIPIISLYSIYVRYDGRVPGVLAPDSKFPNALLTEGKDLRLKGRVMNDYLIGGWIPLYFPDLKVFIDGRTNILYDLKHMDHYQRISGNLDQAKATLDHDRIDYILGNLGATFVRAGLASKEFNIVWFSEYYFLLDRNPPAFANFGQIVINPNCFTNVKLGSFDQEMNLAKKLFGVESKAFITLQFLSELQKINDLKSLEHFAKTYEDFLATSDVSRRVLAVKLRECNAKAQTVALLMSTYNRSPWDIIEVLQLGLQLEDYELVSETLKVLPAPNMMFPNEVSLAVHAADVLKGKMPQREISSEKLAIYQKRTIQEGPNYTHACQSLQK